MCGIVGAIGNLNFSATKILSSLRHRGPDGDGIYEEGNLFLGHTRLAIQDLSENARQPMKYLDELVLTYNGEIYNFRELREELKTQGYTFTSNSDSEVLLKLWHKFGKKMVPKLNGMFAFAILDKRNRKLFLVRDRYGIKPLFFYASSSQILFSSETNTIKLLLENQTKLNKNGLIEYMTFQNNLSFESLHSGINMLPPATITEINLMNFKIERSKYWDFNFNSTEFDSKITEQEIAQNVSELLQQSLDRMQKADVEVASYLSGGVDSSLITYFLSRNNRNLKTFTIGFETDNLAPEWKHFNESDVAHEIAECLIVRNQSIYLSPLDMETCISNLARVIGTPCMGQSYPNYYAANLAAQSVKVICSGVGGDELFAGYPWRYMSLENNNKIRASRFIYEYYERIQRVAPNNDLRKLLRRDIFAFDESWTLDSISAIVHEKYKSDDLLNEDEVIQLCLYIETKSFLHGLLYIEDSISMFHGLETRTPFLDNDLVDYVQTIPLQHKISLNNVSKRRNISFSQESNDTNGKLILRKLMLNTPLARYASRHKQGFTGPDAHWFNNESRDFIMDTLGNKSSKIFNYLNYEVVEQMIREHLQGDVNRRAFIWSTLILENWLTVHNY